MFFVVVFVCVEFLFLLLIFCFCCFVVVFCYCCLFLFVVVIFVLLGVKVLLAGMCQLLRGISYLSSFDRVQFDQPVRCYPWLVELPILIQL